jgi:carbamoyl-phosphate synthase large subunit
MIYRPAGGMGVNTLLVNAGRRVELLTLLRTACQGRVVAVDIDAVAPTLYHADVAERVPAVADPGFVERLLEVCAAHEVGLVVPTTDRELAVLSRRSAEFLAVGARLAIGASDGVLAAQDKLACASMLLAAGVGAVPTQRWIAAETPPFRLPIVVKPRSGSAGEGVRVISAGEGWTAPPPGEDWLVQPLISGSEVTLDVLAADDGRVVCLGARRRLKVRGGEVERALTVPAEPFLELAANVARALSLAGPFNFQVLIEADTPLVGEVNPRLGGGLPLSEQAGAGLLEALCDWARLGDWRAGPPSLARPGVYMTRYDSSTFLESDELAW